MKSLTNCKCVIAIYYPRMSSGPIKFGIGGDISTIAGRFKISLISQNSEIASITKITIFPTSAHVYPLEPHSCQRSGGSGAKDEG